MLILPARHQFAIGLVLIALFAVTRGYHTPTLMQALPGASWAAFFLAGVYLRPAWMLAVLLGLTAFLDYAAIAWGGVSDFCVSPAYVALIPAYASLWLAGRWYATRHRFVWATLVPFAASIVVGAAVCELFSSGAFYFLSGRFAEPTLVGFDTRLVRYFPSDLGAVAFYAVMAAAAHALLVLTRSAGVTRDFKAE